MPVDPLRTHVERLLDWEDAHVSFDRAVADVPVEARDVLPPGFAWSLWQLVEHIRRAQFDILDFARNPDYREPASMSAYWPEAPASQSAGAWEEAVAAVRRDRDALKAIARDERIDLFARIPHGTSQTYLRELILVADHTAYHVGQIVAARRALGIWS